MLARCHLGEYYGHKFKVISYDELNSAEHHEATFIVVDEVHQLAQGAKVNASDEQRYQFNTVREISNPEHCSNLLLLSTSPALNNEEAFLGILHLLEPFIYSLDDIKSLKRKLIIEKNWPIFFRALIKSSRIFSLKV